MNEIKIEGLIIKKTVAIVPVHVYWNACDVEEKIVAKYDLRVIYNAAHAFGVKYKSKDIGNFGGGAISFSALNIGKKLYNLKNFEANNGWKKMISIQENILVREHRNRHILKIAIKV